MTITSNEVEHVARLSKLEIDPEDTGRLTLKLAAITDYMRLLEEEDVSGVEPTTHVLQLTNVFREDELIPCLPREEALAIAPESERGFFKVPSIL